MPYVPQQAPANLDTDGLRRFVEDELRNIARAFADNEARTVRTVTRQTFLASGVYTPTPGMVHCIIECVAGGGAGGGLTCIVGQRFIAGAGGGASYSRKFATAADIGVSKVVTVGTGGVPGAAGNNPGGNGVDTSVGALCIAKGGIGGTGGAQGAGGLGGVAGTGDVTLPGQAGSTGQQWTISAQQALTGNSGGDAGGGFGLGGTGNIYTNAVGPGNAGVNYGGGGSAASGDNIAASSAGAPGAPGVVMITEFVTT